MIRKIYGVGNEVLCGNNVSYGQLKIFIYGNHNKIVIGNKSNLSKIVYIMIWNSVCWKFYSFNWGTNKKQNC